MTEAEWNSCTDPKAMLEFLHGRVSDRKLRLYLCGGCRQIAHLLYSSESLAAVEVSERFAEGHASGKELDRANWAAEVPTFGYDFDGQARKMFGEDHHKQLMYKLVSMGLLAESALHGGDWHVNEAVRQRLMAAASLAEYAASASFESNAWGLKYLSLSDWPGQWLCDCVFGSPFRVKRLDPSWLAWADGSVRKIAQAIYDEGRFSELPLLADALEEAGCSDVDIHSHCRQRGPSHVRGCWVIDLLLGKE